MKNKRKKTKFIIVIIIGIVGMIGLTILYITANKKEDKSISTALSVKKLVEESQENNIQLTGEVVPNAMRKINVDNTKGTIVEIHIKVGDKVKKNQKIFTYYNPENNLALKEAETEIAKLKNKVQLSNQILEKKTEQIEAKYNEVSSFKDKLATMADSEKESTEQKIQSLNEETQALEVEIETLKNERNDGQLDLEKSQLNQNILKEKQNQEVVTSPVDGIVKKIDEEQMNTAVNNGAQSESFIEIMDTSSIKIDGKVDELKKDKLSVGQVVSIIYRKNQEKTWTGKFNRIDDSAIENKEESSISKYPFEILVDSAKDTPPIGSHVYIKLKKLREKELKLPSSFIIKENGKYYIWKVKDGKAIKQNIIIGKIDKNSGRTEIKNGITLQDQILMPISTLKEGAEVSHD